MYHTANLSVMCVCVCEQGMVFDLEDLRIWEPVLYGATSKKQLILDVLKRKESKMMSIISSEEEVRMCVF